MDARDVAWADQAYAEMASIIRRHGWAVQYVGGSCCARPGCGGGDGDGPTFAYTVGLFGLGHPELLVFSLPPEAAMMVLDGFGQRVRRGEHLIAGQLLTLSGGHHRFVAEEVPNAGEIVLGANDFYQRPPQASVPVLQLSYDDGCGIFPWDDGYPFPGMQPRPGTFRA